MSKVIKKIMIILFVTSVFYNRTQDISEYNKIVYVRTSDKKVKQLERWKINEMQSLLVLFEHQKGKNSEATPLQADNLKSNELDLLSPALTAISNGKFEDFYNSIIEEDRTLLSTKEKEEIKQHELGQKVLSLDQGKLRTLINASEKVNAQGVSAFCLSYIMPIALQKNLLVPQLIESVKQKIIPLSQVLPGHLEYVKTVAFSPDGTKIVSGSDDNNENSNLILWDISNLNEIKRKNLIGHRTPIRSVAFNRDGTKIISGSYGYHDNLILWDISNLVTRSLVGDPNPVRLVAFSPDGIKIESNRVRLVVFSPDGTKVVSGGDGNQHNLILWDISNPDKIKAQELIGHQENVNTLAFNRDGTKIVSGGDGNQHNLILWDISNPDKIIFRELMGGHPSGVHTVAFSPDGTKIVSGDWNFGQNNIILWDINNREISSTPLVVPSNHTTIGIDTLAFSPDGTKIVAGIYSPQNNLILWDISNPNEIIYQKLKGHKEAVNSVAFNQNGTKLVSGGAGRFDNLILWDIKNFNKITNQILKGNFIGDINEVAFSQDGIKIVAGINSRENNLILFSLLSKTEETALDNCNIAQAQLLYQIAIASTYRIPIDFQQPSVRGIFNTLPAILKKICLERFKVEPKFNNKIESKPSWIEWFKRLPSHYKAMLGLGTAGISYLLYKYLSQQKE